MALASNAFFARPETLSCAIGHADGDIGGTAVRAVDGCPDGAETRLRCPYLILRGGCTGGMVVIVAAASRTVSGSSGA